MCPLFRPLPKLGEVGITVSAGNKKARRDIPPGFFYGAQHK